MMQIELPAKYTPDILEEIARDHYSDAQADGYLKVDFHVPSVYPDHPELPWASVDFRPPFEPGMDPEVYLIVYGSLSEKHRRNLEGIQPNYGKVLGKWYQNHPMQEALYILYAGPVIDTVMSVYRAGDLRVDLNRKEDYVYSDSLHVPRPRDPRPDENRTDFRMRSNGKPGLYISRDGLMQFSTDTDNVLYNKGDSTFKATPLPF
ncbi:MAG: hypothetical protein IBJ09_02060 [Bacteroidia bacterium]|nr:hypothetical protein [Bacteroidia bacterium]